jgi:hypothetical protein
LGTTAAALPSGLTAGTGLGGGTGAFGATEAGPKPVVVTASADAGGRGPSRSTGTPTAFAARSPFSTVSTAGSSRRISFSAASTSVRACSPGDRSRAASSAPTAAFPAARCRASTACRPATGRR